MIATATPEHDVRRAARATQNEPEPHILIAPADEAVRTTVSRFAASLPLSVEVARTPAEVAQALLATPRIQIVLVGPDDLGSAAVNVLAELHCTGRELVLLPTGGAWLRAPAALWGAVDALLSPLNTDSLAIQDGQTPPILLTRGPRHQLMLGRVRIDLDTDRVFIDKEYKPLVKGALYRLFRYLTRSPEGRVRREDEELRNEVFGGAQPSRHAWNGTVFRLRVALGPARDMIATNRKNGEIRLERNDSRLHRIQSI